jgi:hypothetical protein
MQKYQKIPIPCIKELVYQEEYSVNIGPSKKAPRVKTPEAQSTI